MAGRAGSLILPIFAALLLMAAGPKHAQAVNHITYEGNAPHCGDACCQKFYLQIAQQTDTIDIILGAWGLTAPNIPDCFDHACWAGQSLPNTTFTSGPDTPGDFRIIDNHSGPFWNGPFPVNLTVYICGSYDCLQNFDRWRWVTQPPYVSSNDEPLYEGSCQMIPDCSSGCSYITVAPAGGSPPSCSACSCGTDVCFYNQSSGAVGSFTLNFNPPLDPYHTCGIGGTTVCGDANNFAPHSLAVSVSSYNSTTGDVVFTASPTIAKCSSTCIYIPRCDLYPGTYETVSLVSPTNPGTCKSDNTSIIVDMKRSVQVFSIPPDSGEQNYPNPLEAATGFKTTVPFVTSAGGLATIHVVDIKGNAVLDQDEGIQGPGRHFFYITANDLPAGTYYYTIEFPKGVVIASKTMLVVK